MSLPFFFRHSNVTMPFYVNANIGDEDTQLLNKVTIRVSYSYSRPLFDAKIYMELMLPLVTRWSKIAEYYYYYIYIYIFFLSKLPQT